MLPHYPKRLLWTGLGGLVLYFQSLFQVRPNKKRENLFEGIQSRKGVSAVHEKRVEEMLLKEGWLHGKAGIELFLDFYLGRSGEEDELNSFRDEKLELVNHFNRLLELFSNCTILPFFGVIIKLDPPILANRPGL